MYLLDTDMVSEALRKKPNPVFLKNLKLQPFERLHTSVITVMEIRQGIAKMADAEQFWRRVKDEILSRLTIVEFGEREAITAGNLLGELSGRGMVIGTEDTMIAAISLSRGFMLVTGNEKHFRRIPGLKVENWLRG